MTARDIGRQVEDLLSRHEERRSQGIPTVSVLLGPRVLTVACWRAWLARQPRALATAAPGEPREFEKSIVAAWLATLQQHRLSLIDAVIAHLSQTVQATAQDAHVLSGARILRMTEGERERWLAAQERAGAGRDAVALLGWLLTCDDEATRSASDARLIAELQHATPPAWVHLCALTQALAPEHTPGLVLLVAATAPVDTALSMAARLHVLAEQVPSVPLAMVANSGELPEELDRAPESRVKASIRRSLIQISAPEPALRSRAYLSLTGADAELLAHWTAADTRLQAAHALRRAAQPARPSSSPRAVPQETADRRPEATRDESHRVAHRASEDRARSAAERLLFAALQSHPEAGGRFALNQRIDIRFGSAAMEIDLWCHDLGMAVEVDGYYHFREASAYRRDRRKDVLLQHRGYLVVRVLADDVVSALDAVLDTVLDALRVRTAQVRANRTLPGGSP